jgi:hypothetical protein
MRILPTVALLGLVASCAQDVGEIDRTQNNIVQKQDLEGEWYFRQTTVETPYSSAYSFEGDTSKMERGVFEMQENNLFFYRTYEFQYNTETIGMKGDTDTPYLGWLPGETAKYTPNPYQSRDRKFAVGLEAKDGEGNTLACGTQKTPHDFCQSELRDQYLYCGHASTAAAADRTKDNAVCVHPTRFVYRGAPLAIFPIQGHIDVIWEYNPSTGEKTNVLTENSSDRFWYERDYMRVNWAETQIKNFSMTLASVLDEVAITVYEGDAAPEGENYRMFRDDSDSPNYFDYVAKYIFTAPTMALEGWGDVPICLFYPWYVGGIYECTSEQIKIRSAFLKVDQNDTYRPWDYDDHLLGKFGYFRTERANFDDRYDVTYGGVSNYIDRYDLWKTHVYKADGSEDFAAMEPAPIVYYLSKDFPREYVPEAIAIGKAWSKPFEDTVNFLKPGAAGADKPMFVVCENNNTEAQVAADAGQPVAETNAALCRDMDYAKLAGDLRYSFIVAIERPMSAGLLGYGPPSPDPLTGKIISGNAHIYIAPMTRQANSAADLIEYVVGAKDYSSVAEGLDKAETFYADMIGVNANPPPKDVAAARQLIAGSIKPQTRAQLLANGMKPQDSDWVSMRMGLISSNPQLEASLILPWFRSLFRDPTVGTTETLTGERAEEMSLKNWANYKGFERQMDRIRFYAKNFMTREEFMDGAIMDVVKQWEGRYNEGICSAVENAIADGTELSFDMAEFDMVKDACTAAEEGAVRQREDYPILSNVKPYNAGVAMAGDTCLKVEQGDVNGYYWVNTCTVEKLGRQLSARILEAEQWSSYAYWPPAAWYYSVKEPKMAATQKFMKDQFEALRKEVIADIMSREFDSLTIHELGHTLGLRHNFEATTDAMNFPKEYWALKLPAEAGVPVDIFGAEKTYQREGGMRGLQYSSIMDYGAKFNSLWHGLGLYDHAAIKFGYGGIMEVFTEAPDLSTYQDYLAEPENTGTPWQVPAVRQDESKIAALFKTVHYTKIPEVFGGVDKVYARKDLPWTDVVGNLCSSDADCVTDGGCEGCTVCRAQLGKSYCGAPDKVEVPYRFCSDEYAGRTPLCNMWDEGVDPYEITRNTLEDYWWYWLFWGHWQQNLLFHYENYSWRVMFAFTRVKQQFQWWAVNYVRYNTADFWQKRFGMPWEEDLNGGLVGAVASLEGFNALMSVFAIPDGVYPDTRYYGFNADNNRYETMTDYNRDALSKFFVLEENAGRFGARPLYPSYIFYGEMMQPVTAGAIYDRLNALTVLCDPMTNFLNIDEFPDHRSYLVNYYNFFPDKMIRLLGGLTTHRAENYAPCVVEDNAGNPLRLSLRTWQNMDDENFCASGHYLEPEPVDYDFPTTWYRIPMLAAYFGMSLMVNNYDHRFLDTTRIFLKGHEDAIDIPADAEVVEFPDPFSGKTYVAYKTGDKETFDTAFYLVTQALDLFSQYKNVEDLQQAYQFEGYLQRMVGLLELIRSMHAAFDYTNIVL